MTTLRIATRRSLLARTQTGWVAERLRSAHPGLDVTLVEITSAGDADTTTALTQMPQIGAFTRALEEALLDGRADCAVHSLKDLPTVTPDGLVLAAIPTREDVNDALVAAAGTTLATLRDGAQVGTGSPRREQQLRELRPDIEVVPIRGNIDTRARKALDGELDAVILACAGLRRIGRRDLISETLPFLPAPGQGALALECRADDAATAGLLAAVHDQTTGDCVTAERAWLHATGAGCRTSAAAYATLDAAGTIELRWFLDGHRGSIAGPRTDAAALGARAGAEANG